MKNSCGHMARLLSLAAGLGLVLILSGLAATPARAEDPSIVTLQTYVVMASKGETPSVDPALKDLADLLKSKFRDFNRYRLGRSVQDEAKLGKQFSVSLAGDYVMWATYTGVKQVEQGELYKLNISLVKVVETEKDGKKVKSDEAVGQFSPAVARGMFFLAGGPRVGEETMIIAVRVTK